MEGLIGSRVTQYASLPCIAPTWDTIVRTWGQAPIASLAADAGCSHRHLIRQFRTCIGLSPKKVATLLRFTHSLEAIGQNGPANAARKPYLDGSAQSGGDAVWAPWAHIAAECGYFDQSHFIHEFTAFAGATPTQFVRGIAVP